MHHPLLKSHEDARKRMIGILSEGLTIRRSGSLIFVCGGNDPSQLRPQFCAKLLKETSDFQVFQPEFAMTNYFSDTDSSQLDLGHFEEIVGDLSHAIVIFPEGAGSFAETGYFANIPKLAEKTILALDVNHQGNDSFIMMGPARRYETASKFSPNMQIDYKNPNFDPIIERIKRINPPRKRKLLETDKDIDSYDLFCLVYKIVDILSIATYDDILFVVRSMTDGHPPVRRLRDIASILVGAGYLKSVGEFGHYHCTSMGDGLVAVRTGFLQKELEIKLQVAVIISEGEPEFAALLEEKTSAA